MDRYLEAINSEESLLDNLQQKRNSLVSSNKIKQRTYQSCEEKETELNEKQKINLKRKDFLENRKMYIKKFLKQAIAFGIKSSIGFIVMILIMSLVGYITVGSAIPINILEFILGNIAISTMLGSVEYFNVSRTFRSLTSRYDGNIDEDISEIGSKLTTVHNKKKKIKGDIEENQALLSEIEQAIIVINDKILKYRTSRNALIESLIENLDLHIQDFEYQESDINKVLEKQIR